jgi:hypothetical protein
MDDHHNPGFGVGGGGGPGSNLYDMGGSGGLGGPMMHGGGGGGGGMSANRGGPGFPGQMQQNMQPFMPGVCTRNDQLIIFSHSFFFFNRRTIWSLQKKKTLIRSRSAVVPSGGLTLILGTQKWGFSCKVQRRPPADIFLNESLPPKNRPAHTMFMAAMAIVLP